MSTELISETEWRPKATEGAVPRRVDRYRFIPIWLPKKPDYAKDPAAVKLGNEMWMGAMRRAREGGLHDPWARAVAHRFDPQQAGWNKLKLMFPGLGIAIGIMSVYITADKLGFIPQEAHH